MKKNFVVKLYMILLNVFFRTMNFILVQKVLQRTDRLVLKIHDSRFVNFAIPPGMLEMVDIKLTLKKTSKSKRCY